MRHLILAVALTLLPFTTARATLPVALFQTAEIRAQSHDGLRQWQAVLDRIRKEQPIYAACARDRAACPSRAAREWQTFLQEIRGLPPEEQVVRVNRWANAFRYRTDMAVYGKSDYWASPLQFLENSGDCEDYAIMKYVSLKLLGVPEERLRLAVVHDRLRNLAHAVLVVYQRNTAVVLDNLTNAVLAHDRITNYVPYYTVNADARWAHVPTSRIDMTALVGGGSSHR